MQYKAQIEAHRLEARDNGCHCSSRRQLAWLQQRLLLDLLRLQGWGCLIELLRRLHLLVLLRLHLLLLLEAGRRSGWRLSPATLPMLRRLLLWLRRLQLVLLLCILLLLLRQRRLELRLLLPLRHLLRFLL